MKTTLCFILTLLTFVMFIFVPNSFAQDLRPIVRLIYFVPSDRQPQPDIDTKFDKLIKEVQRGYEDIMDAHGFEKKTFRFETDAKGNAVVHTMNGQYTEKHYTDPLDTFDTGAIWEEIYEQFDKSKNFYLTAIDISSDQLGGSDAIAGIGSARGSSAGWALMPASGRYFNTVLAAHELAHAFGLQHDYRPDAKLVESNIVSSGHPFLASFCAAEWLDVHQAFNTEQPLFNEKPTFDMLPPILVSSPNVIRLRFKVTDHDGIHQVQLMTPERYRIGALLGCKKLNGNSSATVEFVISGFIPKDGSVTLRMIDVHGNTSQSQEYPIDISSLLPPPKVISIPDPNLATAVREMLGLAAGVPITQLDMLTLTALNNTVQKNITNLTGLEHAGNLVDVDLGGNEISDITSITKLTQLRILYLEGNKISDISPLKELTRLEKLYLGFNQISDITPLTGLTQLRTLTLAANEISNIRPLEGMTNLSQLLLYSNKVSNLGPLAKLTNLRNLHLSGNNISDITPLTELTNLSTLILGENQISDVGSLTELTNLSTLGLSENQISDVSSLTELTNLSTLGLSENQISDVSPLVKLTNLRELYLVGNLIKNQKPLLTLLEKNPDVKIYLKNYDEPLPVTLSHFRAERTDAGVILKWTTESEIDNAGFYIYRSETKNDEFKVVNPTLIQGAGTTSERNEYMWTDTTAKPNTAYYYRIEDISHAGVRKQLATVRMRGFVSAIGKLTTRWADLKGQN